MKPANLDDIQKSFTQQAKHFESASMNFSKQDYLDYTVRCMELSPADRVLEAAAGTCACGRSVAPFVKSVVCLDATPAMLNVGREKAEESGLANMEFRQGLVEDIPFAEQIFDIVLTRLAFHHFSGVEKPFAEMARVLKKGGKLVVIDMEAAEEELRTIEDHLETLRDPSHVKNLSKPEFLALFAGHGFQVARQESTIIPVSLKAWLALTETPAGLGEEIRARLEAELKGGPATGFKPYLKDGELYFEQRWLMMIGLKA